MKRIVLLLILSIIINSTYVIGQNKRWSELISPETIVPSATYDKIYIDSGRCVYGDCKNGYGEAIRYDGSIVYKGLFHDGQYNGFGLLVIKDGSRQATFSGNFFNGSLNGKGFYIAANGDHFNGIFIDGRRVGVGRISFSDGGAYEGSFDGKDYVGYGTYYNRNGNIYTGTFYLLYDFGDEIPINQQINGFGTMKYMGDSIYTGFWRAGLRHGYGTVLLNDKVIKSGFWEAGNFKGESNVTPFITLIGDARPNLRNEVYLGRDRNDGNVNHSFLIPKAYRTGLLNGRCLTGDCKNGYGIKTNVARPIFYDSINDPDKDTIIYYEGTFVNGLYQGYGHLYYRGTEYYGFFDKGSLTGEGMSIRREIPSNKNRFTPMYLTHTYIGNFIDGERVGYGKMLIAENAFYEGSFLSDGANGNGTFYRVDGSLYIGEVKPIQIEGIPWEQDPLGSGNTAYFSQKNPYKWIQFSGFGILKYRNDSTYIGNWSDGQRAGIGKLLNSKTGKTISSGLWESGKLRKKIAALTEAEKVKYGLKAK